MSLDLLGAELEDGCVGAAPAYAATLSPGAFAAYSKHVSSLYAKGMKPDDVDRQMATYGASYFESQARAAAPATSPAAMPGYYKYPAAGAAMKSCGADGDLYSWVLLILCMVLLYLSWLAGAYLVRRRDGLPREGA